MSVLLKKFGEFFYKKSNVGGYRVTRILCFKFKKKQPGSNTYSGIINVRPHGSKFDELKMFSPNISNIGKNTYSATDLVVQSENTSIGSFCSIGEKVVLGHGEHPLNFLSTSPYFYFPNLKWKNEKAPSHDEFWDLEPICVGNDVWIGNEVSVKNGVTIGDGAVIGTKSIVTKDVPPYAIVAGVPAKIIRYRFSPEIISDLLELKWWELDDEIIKQIPYDNIEEAIKFLKEVRNK